MDSKEIEKTVCDVLSKAGITYSAHYITQRMRDDWDCYEWQVEFSKVGVKKSFKFEYFTGLGHRHEKSKKPIAPIPAFVLYSLTRDAEALDENFHDWCSNCGYDDDSLRALNTYQECCTNGGKVIDMLGRDLMAKLLEVLQDY